MAPDNSSRPMLPRMSLVARTAAATAALIALLVTLIGGAVTPGHSHGANYISELGARGATYGEMVSVAGFLPIGLTSLLALLASARLDANRGFKASILWMLTLPLAYIVAAFARCTAGCAGMDGAQAIHNIAGMAEYFGGAVALGAAGLAFFRAGHGVPGTAFLLLAVIVLACLHAIGQPYFEFRGAAQRVAEVVLFGFLLFLAWRRPPDRSTE